MKAHILTIGDEILIGQIVDTNSAYMGTLLNQHGIEIREIRSLPDEHGAIVAAVGEALRRADVVLMTGGLGPTKDDITKKALADYFGVELQFQPDMWARIQRIFERLGRPTTAAHREQCYLPANTLMLHNEMGTAPGMWFEEAGKVLVAMPGVPYEMKYLMEHQVVPRLVARAAGAPIAHHTLRTVGMGESALAELLAGHEAALPPHIKLAYLPSFGEVRLRLSARGQRGTDEAALRAELMAWAERMEQAVAPYVYGYGDEGLAAAVGRLLLARGASVGTAESCTGGQVAQSLVRVPGASAYYMGSIVAYDNRIKTEQLGISEAMLAEHGAVSEAVVGAMAANLLDRLGVDYAVAVSGIAGPTGGSADKPVGRVCIGVASRRQQRASTHTFFKDRQKNIEFSAVRALYELWRLLREEEIS